MSKFRKFAAVFIIAEIILFSGFFLLISGKLTSDGTREYRVDINRISARLENGEAPADIDTDEYEYVSAVHIYDDSAHYRNEYEIRTINGRIYLFEYSDKMSVPAYVFVILPAAAVLLSTLLLIYIDRKIITPFSKAEAITTELAKGNLTVPLKQEKSRYFRKFLWGLDMLREKLESDKKRELELLKDKKTLILSLSHDIKTPLSAIDLYVRALRRGLYSTDDERYAVLDGMENNITEIKGYMQKIVEASREDIILLETKNGEVYLSDVISEIKSYYCEKMKNLHTMFTVQDYEYPLVYGDRERIIEVMQNVIENALKYGDGESIGISSDEEEDCRLIRITNTGCTLQEDELTHIFDSFWRGSNVKSKEGSGLGLYICRELMRKMDGDIFAEIKDGCFSAVLVLRRI